MLNMKIIENEVLKYAYLMNQTGLSFQQIHRYISAREAYFDTLDIEEEVIAKVMNDFIKQYSYLNNEQIKDIYKAQSKGLSSEITQEDEYRMIMQMIHTLTSEDKDSMTEKFYSNILDYEKII